MIEDIKHIDSKSVNLLVNSDCYTFLRGAKEMILKLINGHAY